MPKREAKKKWSGELSKHEEYRLHQQREQNRRKIIPLVLVGVAAVILAGLLIYPNLMPKKVNSRPLAHGTSMGNPNAAVKVEEFADFQCPACSIFTTDFEPQIVKDYVSSGKIDYKFVPYSFLGDESVLAAQAAYCANDQNKFWEYHDTLYTDQHSENSGWLTSAHLTDYARGLGLNMSDFTTCLSSAKYEAQVKADLTYGTSKKVDRTPSFLVNGRLVFADTVTAVIDTAVKAAAAGQ
jgi:protein-disulfide isomerase